jgi:hypothetical protein
LKNRGKQISFRPPVIREEKKRQVLPFGNIDSKGPLYRP